MHIYKDFLISALATAFVVSGVGFPQVSMARDGITTVGPLSAAAAVAMPARTINDNAIRIGVFPEVEPSVVQPAPARVKIGRKCGGKPNA